MVNTQVTELEIAATNKFGAVLEISKRYERHILLIKRTQGDYMTINGALVGGEPQFHSGNYNMSLQEALDDFSERSNSNLSYTIYAVQFEPFDIDSPSDTYIIETVEKLCAKRYNDVSEFTAAAPKTIIKKLGDFAEDFNGTDEEVTLVDIQNKWLGFIKVYN